MSAAEPLEPVKPDHVARPALPWRAATLTECGKALTAHPGALSRDEMRARIGRLGQQRAAMFLCMTCWSVVDRWPTWEQDPVAALGRETVGVHWMRGHPVDPKGAQLRGELYALAALVAAHREEFEEYLQGLAQTVSLAEHRRTRARTPKAGRR